MGAAHHFIVAPTDFGVGDIFSTSAGSIGSLYRLETTLQFTADGLLVLEHRGKEVWRSGPAAGARSRCVFQEDGNLVIYDEAGAAVWSTSTFARPGAIMALEELGHLRIYDPWPTKVWSAPDPTLPVAPDYTWSTPDYTWDYPQPSPPLYPPPPRYKKDLHPPSLLKADPDGAWWTEATLYDVSAITAPVAGGITTWNSVPPLDYLDLLAASQVRFVTHCPIDRGFIAACHRRGIRCFPYVSFWFGTPATDPPAQPAAGSPAINRSIYQGVDWSTKRHWYEYHLDGIPSQPTYRPLKALRKDSDTKSVDGVGVKLAVAAYGVESTPDNAACLVCPNNEDYQRAMLQWVQYVMQQGADGLYIDGVTLGQAAFYGRQLCESTEHEHIFAPEPHNNGGTVPQNSAYAVLLRRVRDVVTAYRPDGKLIGNTGGPLNTDGRAVQDFSQCLDGESIEHFVFTGTIPDKDHPDPDYGWTGQTHGPPAKTGAQTVTWAQACQRLKGYIAAGGRVLTISNFGHADAAPDPQNNPTPPTREQAFLAYAAAMAWDLVWLDNHISSTGIAGDDWPPPTAKPTPKQTYDMASLDLGRPLDATVVTGEQAHRRFEYGLVVVNFDLNASVTVPLPDHFDGQTVTDVFARAPASIVNDSVTVAANSGRVFTIPYTAANPVDPTGHGHNYGVGILLS